MRQLSNAQGHQIRALCHHNGGAHPRLVVAQRHSVVRRVGDDDVGAWHFFHHALPRLLLLHAANSVAKLRTAFAVAGFLANLLARHPQRPVVLPKRQRYVDQGDSGQRTTKGNKRRTRQR